MRTLLIAFLILGMGAPAFAQTAAAKAGATAQTPATLAPLWRVDTANSSIGFASSVDGTGFRGVFQRWSAGVRFDPANLAGSSIRVIVEPASASSGLADRDKTLQEADWFDTARHRQVVFQANTIRSVGTGRYEAVGALTVKGRAVPVTLPFTVTITGSSAVAQGALTLDRTQLGLGAAIPADLVPAAVAVTVRVTATRM
ncbi:MAG: YceI family protein [Hyphomonadaceae bacterium]|nr:YceI family protein [Hyphomonadaceae bacterium]